MQAHVDRVENDPGVGPPIEHTVDDRAHLLRRQGPAGGIVDGHEIDTVDVDTVRDLVEIVDAGVHIHPSGRQEEDVHTSQGHLIHRA